MSIWTDMDKYDAMKKILSVEEPTTNEKTLEFSNTNLSDAYKTIGEFYSRIPGDIKLEFELVLNNLGSQRKDKTLIRIIDEANNVVAETEAHLTTGRIDKSKIELGKKYLIQAKTAINDGFDRLYGYYYYPVKCSIHYSIREVSDHIIAKEVI